jgi:hypothetical protein
MFKRWDKMAKAFTRIGKDIAIAVKAGGPARTATPRLRRVIQNARAANMPKDKIENAIKKASGQGAESYDIVMYEGYAPHGIAVMVETATNNVVRTVANVRSAFKTYGGSDGERGQRRVPVQAHGRVPPRARRAGRQGRRSAGAGPDRPRPRRDGRGHQRQGRAADDHPRRVRRLRQAASRDRGAAASPCSPPNPSTSRRTWSRSTTTKAKDVLELVDALEQDEDVQRVFHNLG